MSYFIQTKNKIIKNCICIKKLKIGSKDKLKSYNRRASKRRYLNVLTLSLYITIITVIIKSKTYYVMRKRLLSQSLPTLALPLPKLFKSQTFVLTFFHDKVTLIQ